MSFNAKTIAFSLAALLALAGGIYAALPAGQDSVSGGQDITASAVAPQSTAPVASQANSSAQPTVQATPVAQAPKKLTRQQLTPPPATEEEKLQKTAQQESNF